MISNKKILLKNLFLNDIIKTQGKIKEAKHMEIIQEISKFEIICHTQTFDRNVTLLHWHDKCEICQVLKNHCSFMVDGQMINASEGDIIAISEYVVHQFFIEENGTQVRICQLPLKILLHSKSAISPLRVHIKAEEIRAVPELEQRLKVLFAMMEQEKKAKEALDNPFLQSIATAVYFLLERHFSAIHGDFSQERDRREFYKIIDYINEHFKEDITGETVAKQLYFSRGRLTAVFKKYAGEGVAEYISRLRIKNANYLLAGGTNITGAALESGFQSIRTFNNVYKSIMNMTPSEYIKAKKSDG